MLVLICHICTSVLICLCMLYIGQLIKGFVLISCILKIVLKTLPPIALILNIKLPKTLPPSKLPVCLRCVCVSKLYFKVALCVWCACVFLCVCLCNGPILHVCLLLSSKVKSTCKLPLYTFMRTKVHKLPSNLRKSHVLNIQLHLLRNFFCIHTINLCNLLTLSFIVLFHKPN